MSKKIKMPDCKRTSGPDVIAPGDMPEEGRTYCCEGCGKQATRMANVTIDVHWYDFKEERFVIGDAEEDIRNILLCDDCDFGWNIPPAELKRMGALFYPTSEQKLTEARQED